MRAQWIFIFTCCFCSCASLVKAAICRYSSTATDACDATAITGSCANYFQIFANFSDQFIESRGYPITYPDNIVCRWVISACNCVNEANPSQEYRIELELVDSDIQASPSCTKDFLEIRDGPRLWDHAPARYCGTNCSSTSTRLHRSTKKFMLLSFQSDVKQFEGLPSYRGFRLRYKCVPYYDDITVSPSLTTVNFVLMALSCCVFGSLIFAVIMLLIRERMRRKM